jgi:hypothetical protein
LNLGDFSRVFAMWGVCLGFCGDGDTSFFFLFLLLLLGVNCRVHVANGAEDQRIVPGATRRAQLRVLHANRVLWIW